MPDIVAKACIIALSEGRFYKDAHNLSVHRRKQATLITAMKTTCPRDTNRWAHFGNMIKWMLDYRRRILDHIVEKQPRCAPSQTLWMICAAIAPLILTLNTTLIMLQERDPLLSQQQRQIENVVGNLCTFLQMKTDEQVDLANKQANECEIQAERNSNNEIRQQGSPPVTPGELVLLRTSTFIEEVLDPHRVHISQFWDVDEIDQIENDHQELRSAFST